MCPAVRWLALPALQTAVLGGRTVPSPPPTCLLLPVKTLTSKHWRELRFPLFPNTRNVDRHLKTETGHGVTQDHLRTMGSPGFLPSKMLAEHGYPGCC